ncbi:hypothetical protein RclHR1_32500002 [Rhizophagus clarus]|uniref:Uncharacterized protein n=1 Tax=Rhizophagus clarus TaxID=94130 RepID=A0A2Z6S3C1_9GLOM|nr:hypothetical protein RclHR1_32500002 [Rhizophagus clarus]
MKAVFSSEFTTGSYQSLQKCLQDELIILSKVFADFINLPNLHINMHLSMYAQTFGILNNTQVRIKEMHLSDGGIDLRFTRLCTSFTSLGYLLSDWYLTEDKSSNEEQISNDDDGDVLKEFYFNFLICICSSINFFKKFSYITSRIYFQYIFKKKNVQEKSG